MYLGPQKTIFGAVSTWVELNAHVTHIPDYCILDAKHYISAIGEAMALWIL